MGFTKTEFMRGLQCERMLWLDRNHPEEKKIPSFVQKCLDGGNRFGDSLMGIFGDFVEVKEYLPDTTIPDKERMAKKTKELIEAKTPVICEAAFMDDNENYCAVDILKREGDSFDVYEVKNARGVYEEHVRDTAFQVSVIENSGHTVRRVFIIHHGKEPYEIEEVTDRVFGKKSWVNGQVDDLNKLFETDEEIVRDMGKQCNSPYTCWYRSYCER